MLNLNVIDSWFYEIYKHIVVKLVHRPALISAKNSWFIYWHSEWCFLLIFFQFQPRWMVATVFVFIINSKSSSNNSLVFYYKTFQPNIFMHRKKLLRWFVSSSIKCADLMLLKKSNSEKNIWCAFDSCRWSFLIHHDRIFVVICLFSFHSF